MLVAFASLRLLAQGDSLFVRGYKCDRNRHTRDQTYLCDIFAMLVLEETAADAWIFKVKTLISTEIPFQYLLCKMLDQTNFFCFDSFSIMSCPHHRFFAHERVK